MDHTFLTKPGHWSQFRIYYPAQRKFAMEKPEIEQPNLQ